MVPRDFCLAHGHRLATLWPEDRQNACEPYMWEGNHSWRTPETFSRVGSFILRAAGLPEVVLKSVPAPIIPAEAIRIFPDPPADCINIGLLAERLTGVKAPAVQCLEDVFPPPEFLTPEEFDQLTPEAQNWFVQSNVAISGKRNVFKG